MTCKDCLYCEKCYSRIRHFMDVDEGTGKLIEDIEKRCPSFKNKADFVEVVRCINCKHRMFSDMYIECSKRLEIVRSDHFCSYGERRAEE